MTTGRCHRPADGGAALLSQNQLRQVGNMYASAVKAARMLIASQASNPRRFQRPPIAHGIGILPGSADHYGFQDGLRFSKWSPAMWK